MIVTVTMNPALDKTAEIARLEPRRLNRLSGVRVDAGGKGVNVSKMIKVLGGESVCTGFVGGGAGQELCERIERMGIRHRFLTVAGVTRTNLKIMDADSGLTELNEPGVAVTGAEMDALLEQTKDLAGPDGIVVLSGSLPQNAEAGTYRVFAEALKEAGCTVLADADGDSFKKAIEAPPDVIKPNRFELLQYYGLPQDTPDGELPSLCRKFLERGVAWVILSLGENGAMFFTKDRCVRAGTLPVEVRSTVGAGDSMVGAAAYALEKRMSFEETAKLAMAASIGAVTTEGTNAPSRELVGELMSRIALEEI
ncbi:MAG: 1-phosphofructokinase family hexose kinase [Synergistaceae bacterium]|jgi:1-phosphofructokinase|nr:1-phosphofructokinase family hexose kinase [Synergistaceae bacterium]